jgi:hypothetical protein
MADAAVTLAGLRGLRSAPALNDADRAALRAELLPQLQRCEWFTIGVMAHSAASAVAALRSVEAGLQWQALDLDPAGEDLASIEGPVFLKGNQNNGRFLVRRESGLGEGVLITGHSAVDPNAEDTWGPLPLNLFSS